MSGNASDPSTWAPPGESASDLWEERSNFVGVGLSCIAYGVHLTLYFFVVHHLIRYPTHAGSAYRGGGNPSRRARISWGFVAYVTWLFILGTIGIAAEIRFNQLDFIDDRNFPGGPNGFVAAQFGNFVNIFGTVAYVILNWFADGLVIYRFWLIYNFNRYVAIIPIVMLLGSFSMGVMLLYQITQPNANLWTTMTVNFGIPYWTISASLNILVTLLIVIRLLRIRARTRISLPKSHAKTYTSIAAMLVESAALYSFTALFFVITYAINSNIQNLILPVLGQVQAISPLLIMWRVAHGQAISRAGMSTLSDASAGSRFHAASYAAGSSTKGGAGSAGTAVVSRGSWHKSFTTTYGGATDTTGSGTDYMGEIGSSATSPTSKQKALSVSIPLPSLSTKHGNGEPESEVYGFVDIPAEKDGHDHDQDADSDAAWEMKSRTREKLSLLSSSGETAGLGFAPNLEAAARTSSPPNQRYTHVPTHAPGGGAGMMRGVEVIVERQIEWWDSDHEIRPTGVDSSRAVAEIGADAV